MNIPLKNAIFSLLFGLSVAYFSTGLAVVLGIIKTRSIWSFRYENLRTKRFFLHRYITLFIEFLISIFEGMPLYPVFLILFTLFSRPIENVKGVFVLVGILTVFLAPSLVRIVETRIQEIYRNQSYPYQLALLGIPPLKVLVQFVLTAFSKEILAGAMGIWGRVISLEIGLALISGSINWGQGGYLKHGLGWSVYKHLKQGPGTSLNPSLPFELLLLIGLVLLSLHWVHRYVERLYQNSGFEISGQDASVHGASPCAEDNQFCIPHGYRVERPGAFRIQVAEDVCVRPREMVFLSGASGSGKSLLMKSICGLLPPIFKVHRCISLPSGDFWKEGTYLPQEPALYLYPYMSTERWAQVRYGVPLKEMFQRFPALWEGFTLKDFAGKTPEQLSGGMKRVLSLLYLRQEIEKEKKSIILLDEPDTALDLVRQKALTEELQKIIEEKDLSVMYVSHQFYIPFSTFRNLRIFEYKENQLDSKRLSYEIIEVTPNEFLRHKISPRIDPSSLFYFDEDFEKHDVLKIRGLTVRYEGRQIDILSNLRINIPLKRFTLLLGRNGTGKTTLIKSIFNLIPRQGGEVYLNNKNLSMTPIHRFIKDHDMLLILEDIERAFPLHVRMESIFRSLQRAHRFSESIIKAQWEATFPQISWEEGKRRTFTEFSGGERQRIVLRVLVPLIRPRYLFLDEPFNRVDFDRLLEIFQYWNANLQKTSFVIITHNLLLVEQLKKRLGFNLDDVFIRFIRVQESQAIYAAYAHFIKKIQNFVDQKEVE